MPKKDSTHELQYGPQLKKGSPNLRRAFRPDMRCFGLASLSIDSRRSASKLYQMAAETELNAFFDRRRPIYRNLGSLWNGSERILYTSTSASSPYALIRCTSRRAPSSLSGARKELILLQDHTGSLTTSTLRGIWIDRRSRKSFKLGCL